MAYLRDIDDPGIFCDSTIFSDFCDSDYSHLVYSTHQASEMSSAAAGSAQSSSSASIQGSGRERASMFPVLPRSHNFTALGNLKQFFQYIKRALPWALAEDGKDSVPPGASNAQSAALSVEKTLPDKLRRKEVNTQYLHKLLVKPQLTVVTSREWIEKEVFTDAKLGTGSARYNESAVIQNDKIYNAKELKLHSMPIDMTEDNIRTWLNSISTNLAAVHEIDVAIKATPVDPETGAANRCFLSTTSTEGPTGAYAHLKPDIVVIDRGTKNDCSKSLADRLHWRNIYAFVEITSMSHGGLQHVLRQISEKAASIFDVQFQRQFVCALGIYYKEVKDNQGIATNVIHYTFVIVDRSGRTYTAESNLNGFGALAFLRVIYAFCFGGLETMGWDTSMIIKPGTNELLAICVTAQEGGHSVTRQFRVIKLIHSSPILYGRGTRVWLVQDEDGVPYVLKDSWIIESSEATEIEILEHIKQTIDDDPHGYCYRNSCPSYYMGQDEICSTDKIRGPSVAKPVTRIQRRTVSRTIGDPITSFRSKLEFVGACLDVVNGMSRSLHRIINISNFFSALDYLNSKANIIHGDISVNNILIGRWWKNDDNEKETDQGTVMHISNITPSNIRTHLGMNTFPSPDTCLIDDIAFLKSNDEEFGCEGSTRLIEHFGMLIDCDFARFKDKASHQASVRIHQHISSL